MTSTSFLVTRGIVLESVGIEETDMVLTGNPGEEGLVWMAGLGTTGS